jgi:ATP-dependent DNA helicase RecG
MNRLSDEELTDLLDNLESDCSERKRAWTGDAPEKARQAVCAFANDLPNHGQPGVVFVGADDDGSVANIEVTDKLLQTLSDMKTDGRTVPPPTLTVERRILKGTPLAVVTVWPADAPPVRYEGWIWIRVGPRRGLASAQDERIVAMRLCPVPAHSWDHLVRSDRRRAGTRRHTRPGSSQTGRQD